MKESSDRVIKTRSSPRDRVLLFVKERKKKIQDFDISGKEEGTYCSSISIVYRSVFTIFCVRDEYSWKRMLVQGELKPCKRKGERRRDDFAM